MELRIFSVNGELIRRQNGRKRGKKGIRLVGLTWS